MRVAYVYTGASLSALAGVKQKLADQASSWRAEGHEVRFYVQTGKGEAPAPAPQPWGGAPVHVFPHGNRTGRRSASRLSSTWDLARAVLRDRPDVVYQRFNVYYPGLERLGSRIPTVLEVNSDDLSEYGQQFDALRFLYHRLTRGRLLRRAGGVVFVTGELARLRHFERYSKPSVVIANGIALSRVPLAPAQPPLARPRLVFMGEPGLPWHGMDKIMELARLRPHWEIDVIGTTGEGDGSSAPDNIRFHGYLEPAEYQRLLAQADIGIGTLALHRKSMQEACPLKVREYLATGLPVIIGYHDTDLDDGSWYVLRLENRDDNLRSDLTRIDDFVERVRGRRVTREEIQHLDSAVKERARLRFMKQVSTASRPEAGQRG